MQIVIKNPSKAENIGKSEKVTKNSEAEFRPPAVNQSIGSQNQQDNEHFSKGNKRTTDSKKIYKKIRPKEEKTKKIK
mgnify:CR=1 FL=1